MKKVIFLLWLYIVAVAGSASCEESQTEYFAIFMDGKKAGYAASLRSVTDGQVKSTMMLKMTIHRFVIPISITTSETSIETVDGKPLGFESVQDFGLMKMEVKGFINDEGKLEVTSSNAGQVQKQVIDFPAGAVMSEGLRLLQLKKGLAEGTSYSVKVFSPGIVSAVDVEIEVGKRENVDLLGRVVSLTRIDSTMHTLTGKIKSTEYVDEKLNMLKAIMPVAGIKVEIIACTKKFALSANDIVDVLDKTLLQSPIPLPDLRTVKKIRYELVSKTDTKLIIPSNDNQEVRMSSGGSVIVTIIPMHARRRVRFPYKGKDPDILEALKPTRFVQSDNKEIIALAKEAVGKTTDAAEAARRIEKFVNGYIDEKNLNIGYASAVEVVHSRQGDCTEFAVLTAAMCRSVGIGAQIVMGMLYVEDFGGRKNIFGGHAWNQVYIGGKWIYLDSTRPGIPKFGHIALGAGSGDPESFLGLVTTIGNFQIKDIAISRTRKGR